MTIGQRIKQRREELDMSQDELAQKLGYKSRSSITKIEKGGRELPQPQIKAIADALDTSPDYIMGWNYKKPTEEDFQEWEQKYNPNGKLAEEVNLLEEIQKQHGKTASEAFGLYAQLDPDDQGEIRGEMKHMLKAEKYSSGEMPMLNAAHAIEGASEEDIQHDEEIMHAKDF